MRDQVGAHALRRPARQRLLKTRQRKPRRFDSAERDYDGALPIVSRWSEGDFRRAAVLPDANARDSHGIVRLGLSDDLLHMTVWHHHQALARVGDRSDAIGFIARQSRCST